uniref:alpha-amylase family glycosyl hydrolase n=1 Tax=Candidatus Scatousia sp. TaxID=3085663 RepID=UPI004027A87F
MSLNKYTAFIISLVMIFNLILPSAAIETKENQTGSISITQLAISEPVEKEMKDCIKKIYGSDKVDEIYSHIYILTQKAKAQRPEILIKDDLTRPSDWYKDEVIYMFYADQFGVHSSIKPNTFKDTIGMLSYLKDLGVTTIYILPFMDSPMGDAGFDIRNPRNIRSDLGGLNEFKQFITAAREQGFKIKADLVLNHFSDQHEWFKQALKGDIDKLQYFVVKDEMPQFNKYKDEKLGWVVEYKEADGSLSKRRLIFPEQTEHNYREVTINNNN